MNVGFTGTRAGLTPLQSESLKDILLDIERHGMGIETFYHGACTGADEAVVVRLRRLLGIEVFIEALPGKSANSSDKDQEHRSELAIVLSDVVHLLQTHFSRNRQIVDASNLLIACPRLDEEESTGGTWYTVNYARKKGKPVYIVWPNGKVTREPEVAHDA